MKRLLTATLMGVLVLGMFTPVLAQETAVPMPVSETEEAPITPELPAVENLATTTEAALPAATSTPSEAVPEAPAEVATSTLETAAIAEDAIATSTETDVKLIVKFKEKKADLDLSSGRRISDAAIAEADAVLEERLLGANSAIVSIDEDTDAQEIIAQLESDPSVEYAEPNYARTFGAIATDDTLRASQWALENTGQNLGGGAGTPGVDIDAIPAWQLSLGTSTIVAVIDNGVLYTHPDLSNQMWDGTGCVSESGAALGNCNHGYDFADNDLSPLPQATSTTDTYHGTHVAGIIAAEMNNATGTIGVAPKAKIMALRFGLDVASEVKAIDFAIQNGAKIINASYGGYSFSQTEYDAIARFRDAGGIFIAAAGNGGVDVIGDNNDSTAEFPASYDLANIVSVAATGQVDEIATFSNYGAVSVDLGAPGRRILSTIATNGVTASYDDLSGTSMAAPQVAGVAALLKSLYYATSTATSSVHAMKNALLNGGDSIAALSGITVSGKRLNALGALQYLALDVTAPVITLIGNASVSITAGDSYTDQGATATDNVDGTFAVVGVGSVDTSTAGTYPITYDATDAAGNHAVQVTRTVTVTAAPVVDTPRRRSGGGGGGGGSRNTTTETNPTRELFTADSPFASMTPEARAALLQVLLTLLQKLQIQLAALKAQGL
jgi:subtilisin family serine protease